MATKMVDKYGTGNETEMLDVRASQDEQPRCDRCKMAQWDFASEDVKKRGGEILRCYDSPCGYFDMYERDDFDEILPEACDDCGRFDPRGLPFPMQVDDILLEGRR